MKNPIVSAVAIVAVIVLFVVAIFEFVVGPASARSKEAELNKTLTAFTSSEGKINGPATTDEVIDAVFAGRPSAQIVVPENYQSRGLTLSPVYFPEYDPASNSFKVSFSLVRFVTHKPYVAHSQDNS